MSNRIFRVLFPDAPAHRRTESDPVRSPEFAARARMTTLSQIRRPIEPGLQSPSLISSCEGAIRSILFCVPEYVAKDPELSAVLKSLIAALPAGVRFTVAHHKSIRATIESWFANTPHAGHVTYAPLADYVSLTIWAEDAYVGLTDAHDNSRYLMEPWEFKRAGDALIADAVEETGQLTASQAPLIFQGGNCLIGDKFWLLGRDYFVDSIELYQSRRAPVEMRERIAPATAVEKLFKDFLEGTRQLVPIGPEKPIALRPYVGVKESGTYILDVTSEGVGTYQPIFHIDMLISLAGTDDKGKFRALVGDPRLAEPTIGPAPYAMPEVYDQIAGQLRELDIEVQRNPIVHYPEWGRAVTLQHLAELAAQDEAMAAAVADLRRLGAKNDTDVTPRYWYHITWNNCLVENSGKGKRTVYLPTFGQGIPALATIDAQMKALWEGLGFKVQQLADCNKLAASQGVVHCIKKYLERS